MTVETRRQLAGDTAEQFVVGGRLSGDDESRRVTVQWSDFEVIVRKNEAFTAGEAARIFTA